MKLKAWRNGWNGTIETIDDSDSTLKFYANGSDLTLTVDFGNWFVSIDFAKTHDGEWIELNLKKTYVTCKYNDITFEIYPVSKSVSFAAGGFHVRISGFVGVKTTDDDEDDNSNSCY